MKVWIENLHETAHDNQVWGLKTLLYSRPGPSIGVFALLFNQWVVSFKNLSTVSLGLPTLAWGSWAQNHLVNTSECSDNLHRCFFSIIMMDLTLTRTNRPYVKRNVIFIIFSQQILNVRLLLTVIDRQKVVVISN